MNDQSTKFGPESLGTGSHPGPSLALERILAPIDFSAPSQQALGFAGGLAKRFGATVSILHVVEPPALPEWGYAHIPLRDAKLRRAAEEQFPSFIAHAGIDSGIVPSTEIRNGLAGQEICRDAESKKSDLIVLARHGVGGLEHAFVGGTVDHVLRHAPCPVLTLPGRANGKDRGEFLLKRILVTTDFSEESKVAFPYAQALARKFEASLTLLYVLPTHLYAGFGPIGVAVEEQSLLETAREQLPQFRQAELDPHMHVETMLLNGSPAREICRAAESQTIDLIVIATHGRTGFKRLLLGSVTQNVVHHAPCPVLVVRKTEHDFVKSH